MLNESNLHNYQAKAVDHVLNVPRAGLFLDMGLGKTVSTLTAINKLIYEELLIDNALIIAPKRVVESTWTDELKKWEHLKDLKAVRVIGNEKQRISALKEPADIHLISRDNIVWLVGLYGGNMLPFDMLVIDELSSFKNHKSQRFKALKMVLPSFDRVVGLTGTPTPNGLIDLWAQVYLLDRGERLGKFISQYRKEFFHAGASKGNIVYKYDINHNAEDEIYNQIRDICISMKAEDYLDLPKRIDNFINIPMPSNLSKKYQDFEKEKVLQLLDQIDDENDISAANAAALSNKLLQFANGAVYDEDKNVHVIHDLKIKALEDVIEAANGRPVLVAYTFKSDRDRILTELKKYDPVLLKGADHIRAWNAGEIPVLLMHPASGGHGLNLQDGGNIIVWYGQTWSLELYQQFNARLHRQGQKRGVVVNHLITAGTMDEKVVKALDGKSEGQETLMQAIKSKLKKYEKFRL